MDFHKQTFATPVQQFCQNNAPKHDPENIVCFAHNIHTYSERTSLSLMLVNKS